jgi:hypothetical protein
MTLAGAIGRTVKREMPKVKVRSRFGAPPLRSRRALVITKNACLRDRSAMDASRLLRC